MAAGSRSGRSVDFNGKNDESNGNLITRALTGNSSLKASLDNKLVRLTVIVMVIGITVIAIAVPLAMRGRSQPDTGPVDDGPVLDDCHPDKGKSEEEMKSNCKDRGCVWNDKVAKNTPICSYPPDFVNYLLEDQSIIAANEHLIKLKKTNRSSGFEDDSERVHVTVKGMDENFVRIKVTDGAEKRWESPLPLLSLPDGRPSDNPKYAISVTSDGLTISRRGTTTVIFRTHWRELIFARQFIQMRTNVTSKTLFGLGESMAPHEKTVSTDRPNDRLNYLFLNYGTAASRSSYGTHPFYLMYEKPDSDVAHGVLLLNSNPMDVTFTQTPSLTYRTIGGILDFMIFVGPTAGEVLKQKAGVIGHSPMPPYWSLGFHLCRYGYESVADIRETIDRNAAAGIPVDGQWADIDYMDQYSVFTRDQKNFADLPDLVQYLHETGRRFIPILDPALAYETDRGSAGWPSFKRGIEKDVFVKNTTNKLLLTQIWNPVSVIPDFTSKRCTDWWHEELVRFYSDIEWDGLWIDMNEPATMGYDGQIGGCANHSLDRPQYNPAFPQFLEKETICMSSKHDIGPHYNVHNVYSLFQAKATYESMLRIRQEKRPFLLSRASFTGQGAYSSHWTGDIDSSWEHMRQSIATSLDFNLFGIPLVGADICGFTYNTTTELCSRWSALGAFYSFSRNHNMYDTVRQDPAAMGGDVLLAATKALNTRYTLLPYLYTLFYQNSRTGAPVLRSLRYNFPHDKGTHGIETQFMWGDSLIISPVLHPGVTSVSAYFPAGRWYDFGTKEKIPTDGIGAVVDIDVPLTDISVAMRGGTVFPTISSVNMTTEDQRKAAFTLIAVLGDREAAKGQLYWDDGETLDASSGPEHHLISFTAELGKFKTQCLTNYDDGPEMLVKELLVIGVPHQVIQATYRDNRRLIDLKFEKEADLLTIHLPPDASLKNDFVITWPFIT